MVRTMLQALTPAQQLRGGRLPRRLIQLFVGLSLFGVSNTLLLRANLGLDPWNVFHRGLMHLLPLTIGQVIIVVGLVVLLAWIPLRQWPGLGTIANVLWAGIATDFILARAPHFASDALGPRVLAFCGGVVVCAAAVALYIGTQLGPGPRDGLMTGFAQKYGRSIRTIRTALELFALSAGWLMGGELGIGTLVYALSIGPLVQFFLRYALIPVKLEADA